MEAGRRGAGHQRRGGAGRAHYARRGACLAGRRHREDRRGPAPASPPRRSRGV